jgi:hypothetical protein
VAEGSPDRYIPRMPIGQGEEARVGVRSAARRGCRVSGAGGGGGLRVGGVGGYRLGRWPQLRGKDGMAAG